jgi:hypothetical protein
MKTNVSNNLTKFYTKPEIATYCVSLFQNHFNITKNDLIIEPSKENGSFLLSLNKINCKKCYLDIVPENKQVFKQDFLKYNIDRNKNKIHVINNPLFSKRSSMTLKFIKTCSYFC